VKGLILIEFTNLLKIVVVDIPEPVGNGNKVIHTFATMELYLINSRISVSERFRFQSFDQLRRILVCFRFPEGKIKLKKGYIIEAEELLMISDKALISLQME
jgi:hypothetical protein